MHWGRQGLSVVAIVATGHSEEGPYRVELLGRGGHQDADSSGDCLLGLLGRCHLAFRLGGVNDGLEGYVLLTARAIRTQRNWNNNVKVELEGSGHYHGGYRRHSKQCNAAVGWVHGDSNSLLFGILAFRGIRFSLQIRAISELNLHEAIPSHLLRRARGEAEEDPEGVVDATVRAAVRNLEEGRYSRS